MREFPEQRAIDGVPHPEAHRGVRAGAHSGAEHVRFNIETKLTPTSGDSTPGPGNLRGRLCRGGARAGLTDRVTAQSAFDCGTIKVMRRYRAENRARWLPEPQELAPSIRCIAAVPGAVARTAGLDIDDFRLDTAAGRRSRAVAVWSPLFRQPSHRKRLPSEASGSRSSPGPSTSGPTCAADRHRVDGIITDYPNRLRELMAEKDMPLPPGDCAVAFSALRPSQRLLD